MPKNLSWGQLAACSPGKCWFKFCFIQSILSYTWCVVQPLRQVLKMQSNKHWWDLFMYRVDHKSCNKLSILKCSTIIGFSRLTAGKSSVLHRTHGKENWDTPEHGRVPRCVTSIARCQLPSWRSLRVTLRCLFHVCWQHISRYECVLLLKTLGDLRIWACIIPYTDHPVDKTLFEYYCLTCHFQSRSACRCNF